MRYKNLFLLLLTVALLFGCNRTKTKKIDTVLQNKLFILQYGNFEDELDLFGITNYPEINTYLQMKDGFFFIANGKAKKILQLTSYGDLISVFYNPKFNAIPSFINPEILALKNVPSQQAIEFDFNTLGKIAVDMQKRLYVADRLPLERQEHDASKRLLLRDVVLRFSNTGEFIDYLGQQGPGGTPFPYIISMHTTKNNELVVISATSTGMLVSWFTQDCFLKYSIPINNADLPNPLKMAVQTYVTLDSIIPDYTEQKLYLKIDYYNAEVDQSSKVQSDIAYYTTLLYPLNVADGTFGEPVEIPSHEHQQKEGFNYKLYYNPYQFLGITESGWFFFISPIETGYTVQMIRKDGQKIITKNLDVESDHLFYTDFTLSPEGIISALLCSEFEASVVWWRTDSLL